VFAPNNDAIENYVREKKVTTLVGIRNNSQESYFLKIQTSGMDSHSHESLLVQLHIPNRDTCRDPPTQRPLLPELLVWTAQPWIHSLEPTYRNRTISGLIGSGKTLWSSVLP
jgi:hypothetical protein